MKSIYRLSYAAVSALIALMATPAIATTVYEWSPTASIASKNGPLTTTVEAGPPPTLLAAAQGGEWNGYITLPSGILKAPAEYTVVLDYQIVTPTADGFQFYMFARSESLGEGADQWAKWTGKAGETGRKRLPLILSGADDWTLTLGINRSGAIRVTALRIDSGTDAREVPATHAEAPSAKPRTEAIPRASGAGGLTVESPRPGSGVALAATDFGLRATTGDAVSSAETARANVDAFKNAIAACRSQNASRLVIPAGIYRFASATPLVVDGLSDVTIDARGATLLFQTLHKFGAASLSISHCKRCVVTGLSIDWDWAVEPIATLAHIDSVSERGQQVVMTFPALDSAATDLLKSVPWMGIYPIESLRPTGLPGPQGVHKPKIVQFEKLSANSARVTVEQPTPLRAGDACWIRHYYYDMAGILTTDCQDMQFDHVVVNSIPGIAWVVGGSMNHWSMRNCRIGGQATDAQPLPIGADGFHFNQSRGDFLMDSCEIGNCGDDCINIHDDCALGAVRVDDHTLRIPRAGWQFPVRDGDVLELCHVDYSPYPYVSKVQTVSRDGDAAIVQFADTLPATISPDTIVWSHTDETKNVRIANSRFHDNTGRGILLGAQSATIENCVFEHTASTGIQLQTEVERRWTEGHGDANIVIAHNRFVDVNNRRFRDGTVIQVKPDLPGGPYAYPLFHDILIDANEIDNPLGPAIQLFSCKNVIIDGNKIVAARASAFAHPRSGAIDIHLSSNVDAAGNIWSGPPPQRASVIYDPATTNSVIAEGNVAVGR
ncbi:MAG: right-handed parallel beta-helix repeat-containing protein [Capsulimonadaceae bacterium]|nr:right-handed parallel beta-helix repeat-containing protein [Capsulimonadaceae bacterium]